MTTITPSREQLTALITSKRFYAIRWETPFTPCTGITAVVKQERRLFKGRGGLIFAPWESNMERASGALKSGAVRDSGFSFPVPSPKGLVTVRVLVSTDEWTPIIFLDADCYFQGRESPYDTAESELKGDTLFFADSLLQLLAHLDAPRSPFVWGADWETVPSLLLLKERGHTTALHIHNVIDTYLGEAALLRGFRQAGQLLNRSTLKAGFESADVVVTVNRGYCVGLRNELLYTHIMADHLQHDLERLVALDNAAFEPLSPGLLELEAALSRDVTCGLRILGDLKAKARESLPEPLREKTAGKSLVVLMGRRTSQKGHDVAVAAIRDLLRASPAFPAFFFFATTAGDSTSADRQQRIIALCQEFPDHCGNEDGLLQYYNQLMGAADFNCMPSLGEPHGGAFQGTILPIARAVDGLAAQICALDPIGGAARLNAIYHDPQALPSGFTFREAPVGDVTQAVAELRDLQVNATPSADNTTFQNMAAALAVAIRQAVEVHQTKPEHFARLVLGALRAQMTRTWDMNLGGMLALVDAARNGLRAPALELAA